jgi:hypothetical protein
VRARTRRRRQLLVTDSCSALLSPLCKQRSAKQPPTRRSSRYGVLPRRAPRAAAEPRPRRHVPPRQRGRGGRVPQPRAGDAARGVAGAPRPPRGRRDVRPPPRRRLRPLPQGHGHPSTVRLPRRPRRPGRLRRQARRLRRLGSRQVQGRERPGPPAAQIRRRPPRQRQVLQVAHRRLRRRLLQTGHDDALGGRGHPPESVYARTTCSRTGEPARCLLSLAVLALISSEQGYGTHRFLPSSAMFLCSRRFLARIANSDDCILLMNAIVPAFF